MAIQTFTYLIGYNGLIPQYCTIHVPCKPEKIKSINLAIPKYLNTLIKGNAYYRDKARSMLGIPQKRSENYEGTKENYKR